MYMLDFCLAVARKMDHRNVAVLATKRAFVTVRPGSLTSCQVGKLKKARVVERDVPEWGELPCSALVDVRMGSRPASMHAWTGTHMYLARRQNGSSG